MVLMVEISRSFFMSPPIYDEGLACSAIFVFHRYMNEMSIFCCISLVAMVLKSFSGPATLRRQINQASNPSEACSFLGVFSLLVKNMILELKLLFRNTHLIVLHTSHTVMTNDGCCHSGSCH